MDAGKNRQLNSEEAGMINEDEMALRRGRHGLMKKNSRQVLKSLSVAFHPAARACLNIIAKGADSALGVGFALCPRPYRFAAARHLATPLRPLRRLITRYSTWRGAAHRVGYRNAALQCTFDSLYNSGMEFDQTLAVRGADSIGEGGAILVSAHFGLSLLFVRWLYDHGYQVSVVTEQINRKTIPGRRAPVEVLLPDEMVFVRIRQRIASGGLVLINVDSELPAERRHKIEVKYGPLYVSDNVMRFAERARIPLLYHATRVLADGEIVTRIVRPTSTNASVAFEEFCRFLREEIDQTDY